MKFNNKEIISLLRLRPSGNKGWMVADECPYCHKKNKLGVILNERGVSSFHCYSGKCQKQGTLYELLDFIGRLDLVEGIKFLDLEVPLSRRLSEKEKIDIDCPIISLPLGFKRTFDDEYLTQRGLTNGQLRKYIIGRTFIHPKFKKDYIIFGVVENDEIKGYVGRNSKYSKFELDNLNKKRKASGRPPILRYKNSASDFGKMLFGIDEITSKTKEIWLVEGIFSKTNLENLLKVEEDSCSVVLCTFGNKISREQILKLKNKLKSVEAVDYSVVLLYDSKAIPQSKREGFELANYFPVLIGKIKSSNGKEVDPGEINSEDLYEIIENLYSPIEYSLNFLNNGQ